MNGGTGGTIPRTTASGGPAVHSNSGDGPSAGTVAGRGEGTTASCWTASGRLLLAAVNGDGGGRGSGPTKGERNRKGAEQNGEGR